MITVKTELLARDLAFLQLAEDDQLAELGYHYGNIKPRSTRDTGPIDESTDVLIMHWSDCVLDRDDVLRKGVSRGSRTSARASKNLLREGPQTRREVPPGCSGFSATHNCRHNRHKQRNTVRAGDGQAQGLPGVRRRSPGQHGARAASPVGA